MKTILITGGAGYIGSHTATKMLDEGFKVIVVDNLSTGNKDAVDTRATFYKLDVSNRFEFDQIFKKHQIDAVLHCAGKIVVSQSIDLPFDYYTANIIDLQTVLEVMVQNKIKNIMFSSTASVYGNNCNGIKAQETTQTAPVNPYAETKLAGERLIHWVCSRYNMNYVIFRYFNVAGAALDANNGLSLKMPTHIIPSTIKTVLGQNKELLIYGDDYDTSDGTCIRDYIHVLDLANAHTIGMNYLFEKKESNLFNLGTSQGFSVKQIVQNVQKVTNLEVNHRYVARRQGDPASVLADASKALKVLGWSAKYTLEDIISTDYHWRLKHPNGHEE